MNYKIHLILKVMWIIFKKSETEKNYEAEYEEHQKENAKRINDYKTSNPLKYKSGYKVFNWVVFRAEHEIKTWSGLGVTDAITSMKNLYGLVNFKTGEIIYKEELFLDELTEAKKAIVK